MEQNQTKEEEDEPPKRVKNDNSIFNLFSIRNSKRYVSDGLLPICIQAKGFSSIINDDYINSIKFLCD